MPNCVDKILKYNPGEKSLKAPFAIYFDLECLLKKIQSSQNNPKKSCTEKKLSMNLLVGQCLQGVHLIKKKINLIITEEKIVLKLCNDLKEYTMKIIDYEEKEIIPLNHEENNFYMEQEAFHICK